MKVLEDLRISSPPQSEESGRQMRWSELENALLSELQMCEMEGLISPGPEIDSKKRSRGHFEAFHYNDECMDIDRARLAPPRRRRIISSEEGIRESSITEPMPAEESKSNNFKF